MTPFFRIAVVTMTLVASSACTTMRAVEPSPVGIQQHIEPGDYVKVTTTQGNTLGLEVDRVEDEALYGSVDSGKRFKVPYKAIRWIEQEETSAGAVAAGFGAGYVAMGILGMVLFVEAVEDSFEP